MSSAGQTPLRTDAPRRTAAAQQRLGAAHRHGQGEQEQIDSDTYLDKLEELLNGRVDENVGNLARSLGELVRSAAAGPKDKYKVAQEALESQERADSMIRSVENLLSLTHTLKMIYLLCDERTLLDIQQARTTELQSEIDALRNDLQSALDAP
ncbi:uncharacterized protein L969DRAFT_94176 [Mixia osmundae IAM 14324]|uniref:Mediator complex subunit 22 n=1 Tax=Mixia osmundae (strain CBS 9802 / IAM 14324 / JCM 22182 / KY 12970) TaxID=764103 RepID=G7E6K7_MIXOS|nr:uncharacterized protein L969DRAFT_94176 [Mixia osmundae IAM 14324]KEI40376.1 hypothetical protein L969DRAFT_94176 [Mixia osmundae IAM 14324]GAA98467.1 hypothetical protein E5Q_05153 [Mixia osmundae IAM 14324]